ncbi:hypothetical protein M413DRAFT_31147 [Hebeloma cylindrosporum]|uniref:F-box domain-containing protein n=1 Tax=Hebeloma cylindrosporum TaxID=76867 RepID=A0A0C2XH88_HEBCY|nr:hypothetical protein M413DRAFT_31147 [Hebeloma cylindrosporum h7]
MIHSKPWFTRRNAAFEATLPLRHKLAGPPKLPPELERYIFEICAYKSQEACADLLRVARRVYEWVDPILIESVCITEDFDSKFRRRVRLEGFLAKLTNGKPRQYYVQHIKNLAIFGRFFETAHINRIVAICSGVENLLVLPTAHGLDFFEDPHHKGRRLRRLAIDMSHCNFDSLRFGTNPHFYHRCFANLTHLHIMDDDEDWCRYAGWETLVNLTHIAFACYSYAGREAIAWLLQKLPTIRYVAFIYYHVDNAYEYYINANNSPPHTRPEWGARVVFLSGIPQSDWERGARGQGDFWDVVERLVQRGLPAGSVE